MKGLPLKKLVLGNCTSYSEDGILYLLSKCRCIEHLDLQKGEFLNNYAVNDFSLFLGNLVSINVIMVGISVN